jgi:hypothetical protein
MKKKEKVFDLALFFDYFIVEQVIIFFCAVLFYLSNFLIYLMDTSGT